MKPLPLTTRKQLPNPHRASHRVSKSTPPVHENTRGQPTARRATRARGSPAASGAAQRPAGLKSRPYLSMITGSEGVSFLLPQLFLSQHRLRGDDKERCQNTGFGGIYFSRAWARLGGGRLAGLHQTLAPRPGLRPAPFCPALTGRAGPTFPCRAAHRPPERLAVSALACGLGSCQRATLEIVMLKYGKHVVVFVFAVN